MQHLDQNQRLEIMEKHSRPEHIKWFLVCEDNIFENKRNILKYVHIIDVELAVVISSEIAVLLVLVLKKLVFLIRNRVFM